MFKDYCKELNIKPLSLILDVRTRWNSTYDMLERALTMLDAYNKTCNNAEAKDAIRYLAISEREKEYITKVKDILKPFKSATTWISGEK